MPSPLHSFKTRTWSLLAWTAAPLAVLLLSSSSYGQTPQNICQRLNALNSTATVCDLSGKNLSSLSPADFSGLSNLRILYLHNNALTTLPDNLFNGLPNLQELYLGPAYSYPYAHTLYPYHWRGGNRLTSISADAFSGLSKLEYLSLTKNRLTSLPKDVFDGLSKIQGLGLGENNFTTLPEDIFDGLSKLKGIELGSPGYSPKGDRWRRWCYWPELMGMELMRL